MAAQQRAADKEEVGKLLAHLRDFHAAGDRVRPPVFIGREDELTRINWRAARLGSVDGDKQGFTAIVQGPPGAGKTALMREFASRMNTAAPEKGRRVAAAVVPVRDLDQDADAAACAIAENTPLALEEAPPLPQRMLDIWRGALKKGGGRAFGTLASIPSEAWPRDRLEADVLREALHLPRNGSPDSCLRALSRHLWRDRLAIVLCVDEAQNIQPNSRAGKFLRAIHENLDQLPIMTLAFGLPDTREQLGKAGLSRLADGSVTQLGCLSEAESAEMITKNLDAIGLSSSCPGLQSLGRLADFKQGEWEEWRGKVEQAIADDSAGFPHHLLNGVRAVAAAILEQGESFRPSRQARGDFETSFAASRERYYEERLAPVAGHWLALGAAFAKPCRNGERTASRQDLLAALKSADDDGAPVSEERAKSARDLALARGILQWEDKGRSRIQVPVPSMRQHLVQGFQAGLSAGDEAAVKIAAVVGLAEPETRSGGG